MTETKIPKAFYNDHASRDLPAPPIIRETARHYVIDADHADAPELLDDARNCTTRPWLAVSGSLRWSARVTMYALTR